MPLFVCCLLPYAAMPAWHAFASGLPLLRHVMRFFMLICRARATICLWYTPSRFIFYAPLFRQRRTWRKMILRYDAIATDIRDDKMMIWGDAMSVSLRTYACRCLCCESYVVKMLQILLMMACCHALFYRYYAGAASWHYAMMMPVDDEWRVCAVHVGLMRALRYIGAI